MTRIAAGQVQSVRGPISPGDLGITMMHEHLLTDLRRVFVEPENPTERAWAHAPSRSGKPLLDCHELVQLRG